MIKQQPQNRFTYHDLIGSIISFGNKDFIIVRIRLHRTQEPLRKNKRLIQSEKRELELELIEFNDYKEINSNPKFEDAL